MNDENKVVRNDSFKDLTELAGLCEPGLVRKALAKREHGTSSSEVHKALDTVTSSPERRKNPVRCAQTLGLFWDSFKDLPSVRARFEENDVQAALEEGYSRAPQPKP